MPWWIKASNAEKEKRGERGQQRERGELWKIAAQAELSNRSRLTEQKEHTGPRCPCWSVLRTRLSHMGGFGLDALAEVGDHSHSHPSPEQVLTFRGLTGNRT